MGDKCFSGVVHRLIDGYVDDMSTHAGGNDEVAEALALKDMAGVLGAENNAVNCRLVRKWVFSKMLGKLSYRSQTSASDTHRVSAPR